MNALAVMEGVIHRALDNAVMNGAELFASDLDELAEAMVSPSFIARPPRAASES